MAETSLADLKVQTCLIQQVSMEMLMETGIGVLDLSDLFRSAEGDEFSLNFKTNDDSGECSSSSFMNELFGESSAEPAEVVDFSELFADEQFEQEQLRQIFNLVEQIEMTPENTPTTSLDSPSAEVSYSNVVSLLDGEASVSSSDAGSSSEAMEVVAAKPAASSSSRRRSFTPSVGSSASTPSTKRESNKIASNRYRTKKQHERDQLFAEHALYAAKNREMKSKIDDLQTEISFIKNLLVQALITKTKLKP